KLEQGIAETSDSTSKLPSSLEFTEESEETEGPEQKAEPHNDSGTISFNPKSPQYAPTAGWSSEPNSNPRETTPRGAESNLGSGSLNDTLPPDDDSGSTVS